MSTIVECPSRSLATLAKVFLRSHSLVKACDPSILSRYKIRLNAEEGTELKRMNDLNEVVERLLIKLLVPEM